jgi:hypothetical protein
MPYCPAPNTAQPTVFSLQYVDVRYLDVHVYACVRVCRTTLRDRRVGEKKSKLVQRTGVYNTKGKGTYPSFLRARNNN